MITILSTLLRPHLPGMGGYHATRSGAIASGCRVEPPGRASYKTQVAGFETIVKLADESATAELGGRIAKGLRPGDAVLLTGELGAGKTTLARAILQALGIEGHVPSPT